MLYPVNSFANLNHARQFSVVEQHIITLFPKKLINTLLQKHARLDQGVNFFQQFFQFLDHLRNFFSIIGANSGSFVQFLDH